MDPGDGLPEDFADADLDGRVVMISSTVPDHYERFVHRREKYYHAARAGAAGFVFRNHVEGCLPPTGSVGTPDAPVGKIPAVGVSAAVGTRLARRADGAEVTVEVECETPEATSENAMAKLGPRGLRPAEEPAKPAEPTTNSWSPPTPTPTTSPRVRWTTEAEIY